MNLQSKIKAFTIVELMLAMLLLSLVIAIAYLTLDIVKIETNLLTQNRQIYIDQMTLVKSLNEDVNHCNKIEIINDSTFVIIGLDTVEYRLGNETTRIVNSGKEFKFKTKTSNVFNLDSNLSTIRFDLIVTGALSITKTVDLKLLSKEILSKI